MFRTLLALAISLSLWVPFNASHAQQVGMVSALSKKAKRVLWSSKTDRPKTRRRHYYKTNESRHDLFRPHLLNKGGGYIGVASSQNYNMIAWARSDFAWLIDFDDGIQDIHLIHRAFLLKSKTSDSFMKKWSNSKVRSSVALLNKTYKSHKNRRRIVRIFRRFQRRMYRHMVSRYKGRLGKKYPNWLNRPSSYRYIRQMYQQDRIRVLFGNLLGNVTLRAIGKAAKKVNIPIRVVYLSNAEEWFFYRKSFRRNIRSLPMDKKSVIIRTMWEKNFQPRASDDWQYNVQSGLHFQEMLKSRKNRAVYSLSPWMFLGKKWGITLIDVPLR